ncbi:MAG: hypothetical protein WC295_01140 [Methanoregula sp.]|jgi:hypothetical protein
MILYHRDNNDKINSINRCFFDAEHGWITLSLDRLQDLHQEFPNDPQVQYAEGLIRKDFLGQGVQAEECFLAAQKNSKNKSKNNENYLFSTFNSTKYARNLDEYRRQEKIARHLAPNDRDLTLFDQINQGLTQGNDYSEILAYAVGECQQHHKHGDCAAMAELALQAGKFGLDVELGLRKARMGALRELDKAAEASRNIRGEGFPPIERLTLQEALNEIENAIMLDSEDHMLWNFKSVWLYLMNKPQDSIDAADKALSICPTGYLKPLTNKALALEKLGRKEEASILAQEAFHAAQAMGREGDVDRGLAKNILDNINIPLPSDDDLLKTISTRILTAANLTSKQEMAHWKGPSDGKLLLKALKTRLFLVGRAWNTQYIKMMAEMLTYFCPETVWITLAKLQNDNRMEEYGHCLHSVLYIAAHENGVIRRDACRVLIYIFLGTDEPRLICKCYREAILGSTAVGFEGFSNLGRHMRDELSRLNPVLIKIIIDDTPLTNNELNWARNVTMARFIDGVSRDPKPKQSRREGIISSLFGRIFGNR